MTQKFWKYLMVILLIVSLITIIIPLNHINDLECPQIRTASWLISPIIIDDTGQGNFTWEELTAYPFCYGEGTSADPYILEDIAIDGQNGDYCLMISNSQVYFYLRNSYFYNAHGFYAGITLDNVERGYITNNECFDNYAIGILLYESDNNIISNNYIHHNQFQGIFLEGSSNNVIFSNTIEFHYDWGMFFYEGSNYNTIHDNIVINNNRCIGDYHCEGNDYEGNSCEPEFLSDPPPPPPDPDPEPEPNEVVPDIPGYDLIILMGIIVCGFVILLFKKLRAYYIIK